MDHNEAWDYITDNYEKSTTLLSLALEVDEKFMYLLMRLWVLDSPVEFKYLWGKRDKPLDFDIRFEIFGQIAKIPVFKVRLSSDLQIY